MWGQVEKVAMQEVLARIIPTRVGTSLIFRTDAKSFQDHPHACGDKSWHDYGNKEWIGIIPTRVGTSDRSASTNTGD